MIIKLFIHIFLHLHRHMLSQVGKVFQTRSASDDNRRFAVMDVAAISRSSVDHRHMRLRAKIYLNETVDTTLMCRELSLL